MGRNSAIAWTDHTFNGWWGCTKVSAGCEHCYAEGVGARFGTLWGPSAERRRFGDKHWAEPLAWDRAAAKAGRRDRVFCSSMCDVFEDRRDLDDERVRLWKLIEATQHLDWLLLTKRTGNIGRMLPTIQIGGEELPRFDNVWLGATVCCRNDLGNIPDLLATPAAVRFLSCEPLLEDLGPLDLTGIDWVIVGCESGPKARPMPPEAVELLWLQARALGIPFFFKQAMTADRLDHESLLHGRTWREFPTPKGPR